MASTQRNASPRQNDLDRKVLSMAAFPLQDDDADDARVETSLSAILSSELLQGRKAVSIRHNGAVYRLQATRLGKLILTK